MKNKHETNNSIPMEKKPKKFPLPNFMIFGVLLLCCFSDEVLHIYFPSFSIRTIQFPAVQNLFSNSNFYLSRFEIRIAETQKKSLIRESQLFSQEN